MPTDKPHNLQEQNLNQTSTEQPSEQVEKQVPTEIKSPSPETNFGVVETPKKALEQEDGEGFLEETLGNLKSKLKSQKQKPTQIPQVKDDVTLEIETIMEKDLAEAYKELTPIQQQEFKIKGEQVAWEIRNLLKKTHVKVKSVFRLILEWLKMLPGINKFFLEQEAKIKTDKILNMQDRGKK